MGSIRLEAETSSFGMTGSIVFQKCEQIARRAQGPKSSRPLTYPSTHPCPCQLGGHIPESMSRLAHLDTIELSHCQLMGAGMGSAVPESFSKLTNVKQFIMVSRHFGRGLVLRPSISRSFVIDRPSPTYTHIRHLSHTHIRFAFRTYSFCIRFALLISRHRTTTSSPDVFHPRRS